MTARQLDGLLQRWEENLAAMSANLLVLYEHPTYVTLAGTLHQPPAPLEGRTRAAAETAVSRVRELIVHAADLRRIVDEAARLRAGAGFLSSDALDAAAELLNGESLTVDEPPAAPLEQRALLSGSSAPRKVRPRELLARMETEFIQARGVILTIDAAWRDGGGSDAEAALARCGELLGNDAEAALRQRLEDLRTTVASRRERRRLDPLGTAGELGPELRALETDLRASAKRREECRAGLAEARAWLRAAAERHAAAVTLLAERDLKTADPANGALPAGSVLGQLDAWLMMLEGSAGRGVHEAVSRGLTAWRTQAGNFDAALAAAELQARNLLAERLELRGRLDALHAKAAAAGRAEEPALAPLLTAARQLLHARPTPMAEARAKVEAYRAAFYQR